MNFIHQAQGMMGEGGAPAPSPAPAHATPPQRTEDEKRQMIAMVQGMGFDELTARLALDQTGWAGVQLAIEKLLEG